VRSSATCTTGGWLMEQNADHSVVSATARRGQQFQQQSTSLLPETVHACYVQSYHCVCAMCSAVPLDGHDCKSVVCACIVAADLPNEQHATKVLSIISNVAMTRRSQLITSCCAHGCTVPPVFDTAWTPVLHNRNHPSPASLLMCGSSHSVSMGATLATAVLLHCM
jgi:hypothetical protein